MKVKSGQQDGDYSFRCPGCNSDHLITTKRKNHSGAQWSFNGNVDAPTFSPSINVSVDWRKAEDPADREEFIDRCHFFITNGYMQFLADSTHDLKGKTVPMPELDEEE